LPRWLVEELLLDIYNITIYFFIFIFIIYYAILINLPLNEPSVIEPAIFVLKIK
jgi:hypothetical protein